MRRLLTLAWIVASLGTLAQAQDLQQTVEAHTDRMRADLPSPPSAPTPAVKALPLEDLPGTVQLDTPGTTAPLDSPSTDLTGTQEIQASPPTTAKPSLGGERPFPTLPIPPTPQRSPGQLLRHLFTTSPETRLPGTARSLADVLRITSPGPRWRQEQTLRIRAYWDLSVAMAEDVLAQREQMELKSLHAGVANPGSAWQQAFTDTQARTRLARRAAQVAQYQLQQLLDPRPLAAIRDETLPIPADLPHGGVYDTQYSEIFQSQPSEFAWQLHELLGKQYQQLGSQTAAVEAALARLQQVSQQRAVQSDGSELLRAYDNLRLQRWEFVFAVHTYNRTIADYTLQVMPGNIEADRLVAMLIYVEPDVKPDGQTAQWKRPEIERTGGFQQLPQSIQGRPTTFAETPPNSNAATGSQTRLQSGSLSPTSSSREHSILVPGRGR